MQIEKKSNLTLMKNFQKKNFQFASFVSSWPFSSILIEVWALVWLELVLEIPHQVEILLQFSKNMEFEVFAGFLVAY